MKFKRLLMVVLAGFLASGGTAWAQYLPDEPEWKESEVPPPPMFDVKKLVIFDVSANSSLVYGIDPSTIRISKSDSLVRYVVVATSASGSQNIMYEGIRCSTGEFKTYARFSPEGRWNTVTNPQWKSLLDNMPSKHALRLARAGLCDSASPTLSVTEMVARLKSPFSKAGD